MSDAAVPVSELSYEVALTELEQIAADLDRGAIDVDTLSTKFQRAIDIVEDLDARIAKTRVQVEGMASRLEAIGQAKSAE